MKLSYRRYEGGESPRVGDLVEGVGMLSGKAATVDRIEEDGAIGVQIPRIPSGNGGDLWWSLPSQWRLTKRETAPEKPRPRHDEQTFELAHCVHCGAHVVNPTVDECPSCKAEINPVTKIAQPGTYILHDGEWRKPDGTKVFGK